VAGKLAKLGEFAGANPNADFFQQPKPQLF
jgi:hypothetical protein